MAVTAQVTLISAVHRLALESVETETMAYSSNRLEGIAWLPDREGSASLALTNTTGEPLSVTATTRRRLDAVNRGFILGPHQTRLVDVKEGLDFRGPSEPTAIVSLQHTGAPGALIVTGFALCLRTGFSSNLFFADPSTARTTHLAGAHVRFGQVSSREGFPAGTTFAAAMVIANISNEVSKAHLWVDYTLGGLPGKVDLGQLSLAPGGFQNLDLAAEMLGLGVPGPVDDAGVDIEYSAAPGSVIARIVSFDHTQDFSFDVPMKDPLAEMMGVNTGGYPWRLDGGYNTVVHLKNSTAKPVDAIMQIRYDEGNYNPELIKLGPYQAVAVDIRRLRDAQQRDIRGGVMPRDVISGQVKWIEIEPGSLIGRAEVVNVGEGTASSFSCGGGGCGASFSGSTFSPSPVAGAAGGSGQAMAQEWDKDSNGTMYGPYDKTGSPTTWTSSDTSVATVTGGSVSFVSTGSCTINASWTATVYTGSNCTPTSVPAAAGAPVAVVSVTLSLRYGGTLVISSDDSARQEFIDCTGSDGLSTRLSNGTTCGAVWRTCVEIVGTVTPSNYTGMIVIHRQIDDKRIYNENNVLISSSSNAPDESDDVFRDSDPQSGNSMGKVYDTDGPTISFVAGDPVGAIRRKRVNYH